MTSPFGSVRSYPTTALLVVTLAFSLSLMPNVTSAQSPPPGGGTDPSALAVDTTELLSAPRVQIAAADGTVVFDATHDPAQHHRIPAAPAQSFAVRLQYASALVGEEITADPVDGGRIDGRPSRKLTVGADGRLLFTFTAGTNLGTYPVELRSEGGGSVIIEFQVKAATANN